MNNDPYPYIKNEDGCAGRPAGGLAVLPGKGEEGGGPRPTWLEELSRKQANRRSGFFPDADRKPEVTEAEQKPSLPSRPSEARKALSSSNSFAASRRPGPVADKGASPSL